MKIYFMYNEYLKKKIISKEKAPLKTMYVA